MHDNLIELFLQKNTGKAIADSLPIAIYVTDTQGRLQYYNASAADFSGREPELGTDKWCISFKLYHTDGSPMAYDECPMAVSLREERSIDGAEVIAGRPDGERVWFKAYSTPQHNKEGECIGGINMLVNITDQKEREKQLRQAKDELMDFFDNAVVGLHVTKADGIIKRANQAILDILGYDRKEFVGKHMAGFYADQDIFEDTRQKILAGEELSDYEAPMKAKDGSVRYVLLSSNGYREDGAFVHTRCITRDITPRKQAQQNLRKSRDRLRTALQIDTVGVLFWDSRSMTIKEVNDAFLDMSGYIREEAVGKNWQELTPDEFYPLSKQAVADVKKTGYTKPYEKQYIRKDGSRWWALFAPRRIDENEIVEFVLDISERHYAREELKAMNETLEERVEERTQKLLSYQAQLRSLASQLSKAEEYQRQQLATELHDNLGQLLAVGIMKVNLLQNTVDSAGSSKMITDLQDVLDGALRYTRELMSELKPPPSISGDIIAAIEWIAEKLAKRGLTVIIDDDKQPKPLNEEVRITVLQSVRELLFNVVKHTSEKEAVVQLRRNEDRLRITVKDEGEGFDPDHAQWTPEKNEGFGLFNVLERIDLLGGDVDIKTGKGRGTKIHLYIPLSEEVQSTASGEPAHEAGQVYKTNPPQNGYGEKISVLLVDDHQMVRKGLRKIIEDQNDIIVAGEAGDGEEAVSLSRETAPDIIVMDVNMPKMDGIEATRRIIAEMPAVRVIGLSLHDEKRIIEDMRRAGASAYLTKTEAFESLIVTIRAEASAGKK